MSARLVQHLSCLLILIQKVKELRPNLEVANANLQLYSDKVEKPVLRMLKIVGSNIRWSIIEWE